MIIQLSESQRAVIRDNNGLYLYLKHLAQGKEATPRSWLYERIEPDEILHNWMEQLSVLEKGNTFEKAVFQFDISQVSKWGPQGAVAPIKELIPLLESSFHEPVTPNADSDPDWDRAKQEVARRIKRLAGALRPRDYRNVVDNMRLRDTLESNSGWPLFTKRNKPEVKASSIEDAENGRWKDYPAIVLFRNYNQKTRPVWMFPMSTNLVEGAFLQPLQEALMRADDAFFSPWTGFEKVRRVVTAAYEANRFLSASDFSNTDEHFGKWATLQVFDVIKDCFPSSYHERLLESLMHMQSIPLVIGLDEQMVGWHGVSSGSNWTNFVETIFDYILSEYVHRSIWKPWTTGLYAIGDDMAWQQLAYNPDFADELEQLAAAVGQVVKAEKTTNDPDKVKSLQRLFQRGYKVPGSNLVRGVYSTIRALKSSVYPEKFHNPKSWSSDMFCARQFMILENCVDHPLFDQFVKFICTGNEHLIPFAKQNAAELDKITRVSKHLRGLNPT